jgi:hypothetical protein
VTFRSLAITPIAFNCADGFIGLHNRTFRPSSFDLGFRNIHARGEARFGAYNIYLGKFHGSLSWAVDSEGRVAENYSQSTWNLVKYFLETEKSIVSPSFLIFPGAAKFVKNNRICLR